MTSCNLDLARNIVLECSTPLNGGNKGRAVYIPTTAIASMTKDSTNPRIVSAITLVETTGKTMAINNASNATPFAGSTTAGNTDAGRARFVKTLSCLIPLRGADVSMDLIEALVNDPEGGLLIVEKNDKRGKGSFEIIGLQSSVKVDPASVSRDESANGGAVAMNFVCTEDYFEANLFATDYDTTKGLFDTLYYDKSF